jgi:outer membrane protein TolC
MFRCVFLLWLFGATRLAFCDPLSFAAALETATRFSPDIAAQTAGVEAARSAAVPAGALPDPKLSVGVDNFPVSGPNQGSLTRDFMTMRKIGIAQEIPNGAKREARTAAAQANIERAEAERRVTILTVRRDTALAWLDRYYLERREALFDALERENQLFARTVQAQLATGRSLPADAIAPRQEAAEIADRRDELLGQIARATANLKRFVGESAAGPLAGDPPVLALDTEHLRGHVHEHPELAVFVPLTQMAQAEVHEAEAEKRPDWGVELAYGRRGAAFGDMVSLEFTLGLPVVSRTRQDPEISAKRQELTRVQAQRDDTYREHAFMLETQLADYEVTTRQLTRLREVRLPLARQKVDLELASYGGGKSELTTLLTARRELIGMRLEEIETESRQAAIATKLYFSYGAGTVDIDAAATAEGVR